MLMDRLLTPERLQEIYSTLLLQTWPGETDYVNQIVSATPVAHLREVLEPVFQEAARTTVADGLVGGAAAGGGGEGGMIMPYHLGKAPGRLTAWHMFQMEQAQLARLKGEKAETGNLGKKWKELPPARREYYTQLAKQAKDQLRAQGVVIGKKRTTRKGTPSTYSTNQQLVAWLRSHIDKTPKLFVSAIPTIKEDLANSTINTTTITTQLWRKLKPVMSEPLNEVIKKAPRDPAKRIELILKLPLMKLTLTKALERL